ncbi:PHP-like protein [Planctomycetales bacterium]|nr:PHP-like protein [Planctomycetales bacterium]GHT00674.1 PHP-like protein [Planctomycetales bacterium]GHT07963.1 PHP-like protein [Planctomycetales bacterium]GHV22144.1 PHP-like protein [Planctomycetales bacterium]
MQPTDCIDLHIHSTASDGVLRPLEVIEEAQWRGVSAVALTDHDTVDGVAEALAAGRDKGIEVIGGVELSCQYRNHQEAHIVGLLLEPEAYLLSTLTHLRQSRGERMNKMLAKLAKLGILVNYDELKVDERQSPGRPHLARALVKRKIVSNVGEAFERYLGDYGPVYVERERLSVPEAVELIKTAGGVSILAHPGPSGLLNCLDDFRDLGVQGLEAYYPHHSPELRRQLLDYCGAHHLLASGGSDFHDHSERVGGIGNPRMPYSCLMAIKERKAATPKSN